MAILKRDDILQAVDLPLELVHVPEWGGDVYVRGMSGAERDEFETSIVEMHGKKQVMKTENFRSKMAVHTIVDENGKRLFTEKDILTLCKKSGAALQRVFIVAQRLSGMSEEDVEELAAGLIENPTADLPTA
jgi:hypothetical protein